MVMQERSLIRTLNGLDNLYLNSERLNRAGIVDTGRERREVTELLRDLGIPRSLLAANAGEMSTIEQELIEIARALRLGSRVLILDEPTAPLGEDEIARLFKALRAIAAKGAGIVIITHHLAEVFAISDEVSCLREGEVVLNCATRDTTMNGLIGAMLGRVDWKGSKDSGHIERTIDEIPPKTSQTAAPSVSVRGLQVGGKLSRVSFDAWPGEILGIVGLAGSGRSTLLRSLFGDLAHEAGEIRIKGAPYRPSSPSAAMAKGVFLIPENRGVQSLMLTKSIAENITLTLLARLTNRFGLLRKRKGRELARRAMKTLGVRAVGVDQAVGELSGGNQQKIVLAKALLLEADVLLLDEPTYGVDIGSTHEIIKNVRQMAENGATVFWASSDLLEVSLVADRILVLRDATVGVTLGANARDRFTEKSLLSLMQREQFQ